MATRFVEEAQNALKPVYAQEAAAVQNQLPAIAQLYQTLVGALQQSAGTATADTVASAQRRGVNRPSLPGQITTALQPNLAVGEAQLGVDRAGQEAAIAGNLTDLGVNQMTSVQDLAGALQSQDINNQQFNQNMQALDRNFDLDVKTAAARQARAAREARASAATDQAAENIEALMIMGQGTDGNVSPDTFRKALKDWIAAGGSEAGFVKKFGGMVNRNHSRDYYQFLTTNTGKQSFNQITAQEAQRQAAAVKNKMLAPIRKLQNIKAAPQAAPQYKPSLTLPALNNLR